MLRPLVLLLWCGFTAAAEPAPRGVPHVVIVTVDGLRPNAIDAAGTPVLARMVREGAASLGALVPQPYLTLPSHMSMVTGQTPARHGILRNKTLPKEPANTTLFNAVHARGRRTALFIGKYKLVALAPRGSASLLVGPREGDSYWEDGASSQLASRFASEFARGRYALTLMHLREPDEVGHDLGWMTPEYRAAVAEADRALGVVLEAIRASGLPTTVFLTSDHGGQGMNHWTHGTVDWTVPWICVGPGVKAGSALAQVGIVDVGPTAAAILGVALPNTEGRVIQECLPKP